MIEQLKLIIENAIRDEEYFHLFYKKLAELSQDEKIKEGLLRLSEQERNHKEKLESLNFEQLGTKVIPDKISEIDVAEEVEMAPIEEFSDLRDMYAFAIKQEALAQITYEKLREAVNDPEAKDLFQTFADEEKKHKLLLTGELALANS